MTIFFLSTRTALEQVLEHYRGVEPLELHLSTTLSTNLIVEGRGGTHIGCRDSGGARPEFSEL